nr:GGDEF domain-containing protein [uncultured Lachnoclostridium sp.]
MMNLFKDIKRYKIQMENYTFKAQKNLLLFLGIFIGLYCFILTILDFYHTGKFYDKTGFLLLISFFTLIMHFILNIYAKKVLKYIFTIAYLNIIIILTFLQTYYYFQDNTSYVVYVCIILAVSLSIVGNPFKYFLVISSFVLFDAIIAKMSFGDTYPHGMHLYIIDNLIILLAAVSMNFALSCIKLNEFKQKSEILQLSNTDYLTGLLNRRASEIFVQNFVTTDDLCGMIVLDLDNFKLLNDTFGHSKGDECLIMISKIIKETFRHTDCVSRLGGDEFMIFMPQLLNEDCAIIKCKDILKKLPIKYKYLNQEILITASIGLSFSRKSCNDLYEKMYKEADMAMYLAKKNGKNCLEIYKK